MSLELRINNLNQHFHKFSMILLMEGILHHLGCKKPCKYWDKVPTSTGAGFRPSTVSFITGFNSIREYCHRLQIENQLFYLGSWQICPLSLPIAYSSVSSYIEHVIDILEVLDRPDPLDFFKWWFAKCFNLMAIHFKPGLQTTRLFRLDVDLSECWSKKTGHTLDPNMYQTLDPVC